VNNWQKLLINEDNKKIITNALEYNVKEGKINLYGFVIMPNHIHLLLELLSSDKTSFQRNFNKYTSQKIIQNMIQNNLQNELLSYKSNQVDRIYQIWERRPKWIQIQNNLILNQKLEYIHKNPISKKWDLANSDQDYLWSSAKAYFTGDNSEFPFLSMISH